ncbi:hypothetical protein EDB85DRAFT_2145693 [Lactarius pseudohatsudake]|nr:hypothetical protein EDB85DRAFT_2145693 [Lactarius pseudohatsudake]
MPLFPTFSFPAEQTVLDKYEKFISGIYHGEITRNTLLALDDAVPQLFLFDLNKEYGLEREALGFVESACSGRDDDDSYRGSRGGTGEALVPATLQRLKRQEVEQENFGYAPGEVSLRDRRAPDGRGVSGRRRTVCNRHRLKGCPGFEKCMREALRILLGADEVEKRVEMGLAEDGSGVGTQGMKNKKL